MKLKLSRKLYRRYKKLLAASFHPIHIMYELLAIAVKKSDLLRKFFQNRKPLENKQLLKRNFKPIPISEFTVPFECISNQHKQIEDVLIEHGICILTGFIEQDVAREAFSEVTEFLSEHQFIDDGKVDTSVDGLESRKEPYGESDKYLWQFDYAKYSTYSYREVQTLTKPFINVRSRKKGVEDSGKIDIFDFESLAKSFQMTNLLQCQAAISHQRIEAFLEKVSGYSPVQSNLYFDGGVTTPRGPHIDNNLEQYKIFLYLSDVNDEKDGPYCYVPKSHKKRGWMSKERLINSVKGVMSTEVSSFEFDAYTKMLAPAGTAIISCQSGIHGACPQSKEGRRALILGNYN